MLDTARPGMPRRDVVRGGRWPGRARGVERRGAALSRSHGSHWSDETPYQGTVAAPADVLHSGPLGQRQLIARPGDGRVIVEGVGPDGEWQRRKPTRRFPADTDPVGVIAKHARVDLIFERSRLLTGSVGGQPVRLDLNVPTHDGAAAGTIAGMPTSATWKTGSNYYIYPDVPSDLTGSFAGQPVELHARFHLEPGYLFHHGTITGHIGAEDLDATVEAASGGFGSSSTVAVDGTLGSTEFSIYAAVGGSPTSAKIRGTVAGNSIRIDAAQTGQAEGEQTRLTGSYQGPPALLALAAGALLHFI